MGLDWGLWWVYFSGLKCVMVVLMGIRWDIVVGGIY